MGELTLGSRAFIELIETIADNKYILGDRLVEVGVSGPHLEATLSSIAIAQGELGHARLLYNWAFDLKKLNGKKPEIENQTGKAFDSALQVQDWVQMIATLYPISKAIDIVLNSILEAQHSKVAGKVNKLIREQKEHIMYSQSWAKQLLQDRGAVPRHIKEHLNQVIPEVENWLNSIEHNKELVDEGYLLKDTELLSKFKAEVNKVVNQNFISVE